MKNEYLEKFESIRNLSNTKVFNEREKLTKKYSFAIPSEKALQTIAKYGSILEIGAGTGYWASLLKDMNVDIVATDLGRSYGFETFYTDIERLSAIDAIKNHPQRNILSCWACYDQKWVYDALMESSCNYWIVIGEGQGGCTACDEFFNELEKTFEEVERVYIPNWTMIHDYLTVWKRK